ncbi:MAG: UvrD-helicase domain-containing protein, partial [Syntrophorhabdus sp.]
MAHDPTGDGIPQIITLRSSAGSGKTYQLAAHYLKVLLTSALEDAALQTRMANIVAITFTNKAAGEMRSRIIDWMKRIILDIPFENSPVKPLDDIMRDITMIVPGEDTNTIPGTGNDAHDTHLRFAKVRQYLIDAMDRRFSELLKEFGHFNVGTIDSFINLTLKASAMRLDLPPDFEVSMETRDLIDLVLQECLQMAAEDPRAQRIIDTFLDEYIELEGDRTNWLPIETLRSTILSLWNQEAKENREFHVPRDRSRRMAATIRREMTHKAQCLLDNAVTRNLSLQKNFINALGKCCDPHQDVPLTSAFFSKDLDGCLKKGSLQPDNEDLRLWEDLKSKRAPYVEALAASRFTPHLDVYAFFKEIFRKEIILLRSIVPIDQLNRLLQGIVNTADFVPEIYYSLSERYLHFLIDEFQDTSLLQWKNIEILAEEALSRGGSLFLVGDKKQAIYRWRGGDPNIVEQIAGKYKGQYPVARLNLDTNYRSTEQIVFFNNAVFNDRNLLALARATLPEHDPASLAGLCATYENSQQNFLESRKGTGYVAIERVTDPYNPDDDAFTREKANQFIEEKIKGLLAEIRNRGVYRDKDIAILVRTRDEAQTIVNILLSMDVSVESEYTVSIRNNAIIREVISLLKCIDRPDDNKSFASFITGRTFAARYASRSADAANWLENMYLAGKHGPLYIEFKKLFPEIWDTGFEALVRKAGYLPLYDFLIDCIRHWEILINFPGDAPFLLHFLELAKNLENTDKNTLTAFTAFFEDTGPGPGNENTDNEKPFLLTTADSLDAVRVLTIHKAKGLQFPVVILPFITLAPLKLSGSDRQLFFQSCDDGLKLLYLKKDFIEASGDLKKFYREKELEYVSDELNNLYVAFTR